MTARKSIRNDLNPSKILLWVMCSWLAGAETALGQTQTIPPVASQAPQNPQRLGPAIDPIMRRQAMIGRWFGEGRTSDGRTLRWVTDRENNGTYRTDYLLGLSPGETVHEESTEIGQWGLSGSIFFTIQRAWARNGETQRADPGNVYSYDAYELVSMSERSIEYVSAGTGKRFLVRRVTQDFQLKPKQ
jgi:hypothetical protein